MKEIRRGFSLLPKGRKRQKAKTAFCTCFSVSPLKRQYHLASRVPPPSSFPVNYIQPLKSGHHSFGPCLWAYAFYLNLFCAPVSKMSPKISEKPERGHFLDLGTLKKKKQTKKLHCKLFNVNCLSMLCYFGLQKVLREPSICSWSFWWLLAFLGLWQDHSSVCLRLHMAVSVPLFSLTVSYENI